MSFLLSRPFRPAEKTPLAEPVDSHPFRISGSVTPGRPQWLDRWMAKLLQDVIRGAGVRLELWDGTTPYSSPTEPIGDLVVLQRQALLELLVDPDLRFGEAYMAGRLEIRGKLVPVLEALTRAAPKPSWREHVRAMLDLPNTLTRARRNVHHHYDLGNDFYQQWLDRELVYTCAHFETPEMSLEAAQRSKMDLVCRKLRLEPGMTVVEAGCGWGALALHMARHYGVHVKAFNVSPEQLAYARERAGRERLSRQVEFIEADYRSIRGEYDVFVSVGMLEHVGRHQYHALAEVISRSLRPNGRGLLHFIGRDTARPLNAWIRRRIFPGAYPPTLAQVTDRILAPAGMSVLDVENLRLHYARTLEEWSRRFAAAAPHVRARYGEGFRRAWELYLAGSQAAFKAGSLQLFQVVFAPIEAAPPHWTRGAVYADDKAPTCAAMP